HRLRRDVAAGAADRPAAAAVVAKADGAGTAGGGRDGSGGGAVPGPGAGAGWGAAVHLLPVLTHGGGGRAMQTGPAQGLKRGQRRERRSLAGLVVGLGVFVLAQLLLHAGLRGPLAHQRDPFYGPRLALLGRRFHATKPPPFTAVLLGSSRTYNGIRAATLEAR